jgi:hypothetical protein
MSIAETLLWILVPWDRFIYKAAIEDTIEKDKVKCSIVQNLIKPKVNHRWNRMG